MRQGLHGYRSPLLEALCSASCLSEGREGKQAVWVFLPRPYSTGCIVSYQDVAVNDENPCTWSTPVCQQAKLLPQFLSLVACLHKSVCR